MANAAIRLAVLAIALNVTPEECAQIVEEARTPGQTFIEAIYVLEQEAK